MGPGMIQQELLAVKTLGTCRITSPMAAMLERRAPSLHYVEETDGVLFDSTLSAHQARQAEGVEPPTFEPAGPRKKIFFDPSKTRAGIVTCGGLCPGLNDVIRGLTLTLNYGYGVRKVFGFCHGYRGFAAQHGHPVLELTPSFVSAINEKGGTVLGTSRGNQDPDEIVDCLERMSINILFVIGGDGTIRGAMKISEKLAERGLKIAVVGIPKTIDNDIMYIDQSFGFQTAFSEATRSIRNAHAEAKASPNGVGLVKLMGRHSGFIACYASLAGNDANFVLIPEVPFQMDGPQGFLSSLRKRVLERHHAVVVVAEGAGQHLMEGSSSHDASGNAKLHEIGGFLKHRIQEYFQAEGIELNLKYIDPSYDIRSVPANAYDSVYSNRLAHAAAHAAMSGRTEMVVGRWNSRFVHVPMLLTIRERYQVDPNGDLWMSVLEATGQSHQYC